MDETAIFSPKAIRKGKAVENRFKSQAEKAYIKYKMAKEFQEVERLKALKKEEEGEYSDAMGMYMIDSSKYKKDREGSDTSSHASYTPSIKEGLMRHFLAFVRQMYSDTKFELKWKEFMCITFYLQVPVTYVLRHVTMTMRWGALLVLIVYVIIGACISMPVYMVLMFMGNYSRKSYIRFWECVPLLKGVAYSIALATIGLELFSVAIAGLSLLYIIDLFGNEIPWTSCKYRDAHNDCVPMYAPKTYDRNCCIPTKDSDCSKSAMKPLILKFSTYDYFISKQLSLGYGEAPLHDGIIWRWAGTVGIIWLLIFGMMMLGLRRFRGFMTTINLIILVTLCIPILVLTIFISPNYNMISELESNFYEIINYKFWIETSIHSLHREMAGDVLTFSAVSSPGISTTVDTVCIYTLKLMFLVLFTVWMSISVTILEKNYKLVNTKCLQIDGYIVLFSLFPDVISRWHFPQIWLVIYFSMVFFWAFSATVYSLNSFIGALLEEFPKLVKLRILVCSLFCLVNFTCNIFLLRPNISETYESWVNGNYVHIKVTLLFFTLVGFFIYSIKRLSNDYHFTYGEKLNVFWLYGVRVATLIVTIVAILVIMFYYVTLKVASLMVTMVLLAPIFIVGMISYVKFRLKMKKTLLDPDPKWGPPTYKKKVARSRFDPKTELRYRSTIQKCKHSCLINSSSLLAEITYWRNKRIGMYRADIE